MRIDQPDPDAPDGHRAPDARRAPDAHRSPDAHGAPDAHRSPDAHGASDARRAPDREITRATETSSDDNPRPAPEVPASRADQLAEHTRYREVVAAADCAADARATWANAVPGLRADWEEHKERYPERVRAEPRTEPDGSWVCGEHRRLDPEQNTEVSKAHADLVDEADRHILPALRRVEAADPERRLAGLEHMVKGEDRLKEKLAEELFGKQETVREALNEVPDAVRFTFRYGFARYAEGVLGDVERLKAEGFELIKLKNLWTDNQYRGINSQWRSQETGSRFEMQFHTSESLEAKELTHQAYERIRGSDVTPAERRDARDFQRRVNALLHTPPGTERIKNYPEKTNG
jgi:hypothetical protein